MSIFHTKAGDPIEVGTQTAYRFWRYRIGLPIRLLSFVSDMRWLPGHPVEGSDPDVGEQGIHGFKSEAEMFASFHHQVGHLLIRSQVSGCHGIVFGSVSMWGTVWEHEHG